MSINTMLALDDILEKDIWKKYGAVSTPIEVVDLMLKLSDVEKWEGLNILEPGAGLCDFSARIYSKYPSNNFTGIEINPEVHNLTKSLYPQFNLIQADFLLWKEEQKFDIVIGNPPYGIIGDKSHYPIHILNDEKEHYKKVLKTWFGKYNIYGAFIEKGLKILKKNGKLIYIVPATFMILDDFKFLRKFLAAAGRIRVYYLGPKVFKDKSVSTSILIVDKDNKGIELFEMENMEKTIKCYEKDIYSGEIIRFETPQTKDFGEGAVVLSDIFDTHFAARSPEIKSHPLVSIVPKDGLVPVLTGGNLKPGWIDYNNCYSGLWMPREAAPSLRPFYGFSHLVVGHTKGGKVVAAVDKRCYPWREEIHLVPRIRDIDLDMIEAYLNSQEVQRYMNMLYKDITPHLTITQLKLLPIPRQLINVNAMYAQQGKFI